MAPPAGGGNDNSVNDPGLGGDSYDFGDSLNQSKDGGDGFASPNRPSIGSERVTGIVAGQGTTIEMQ